MDLELLAVERRTASQLLDECGLARRRRECRDEILVRTDVVDDRSRLDDTRPADHTRNAERTFPVGVLLALERRRAAVSPGEAFSAIVGGVHHHGVVCD